MQTRINYFSEPSQFANFFSTALQNKISQIAESLDDHQEIMVFPDATLKTNLFPNGIACLSKANEALLMPFLLSDPGCGYLLFSLETTEKTTSNWQQQAGKLLDEVINRVEPNFQSLTQDENKQLQQLLQSYDLTAEEAEAIRADFLSVTNTIEIRQPINYDSLLMAEQQLSADKFIGFIHGGSHAFPKILAKRFVYRIAEFADTQGLFTLDNIKQGIFGVHARSSLGQEYIHWLELAMQFADLNRYAVFTRINHC